MPFNARQQKKVNRSQAARQKKQNNHTRKFRFPTVVQIPEHWEPPRPRIISLRRDMQRPPILQTVFWASILAMRRGIDLVSLVKADPELRDSLGLSPQFADVPKFGNGTATFRGSVAKLLRNDADERAAAKAASFFPSPVHTPSGPVSKQAEDLLKQMCSRNNPNIQCLDPEIQAYAINLLRLVEERNLPNKSPENDVCRLRNSTSAVAVGLPNKSLCETTLGIPRDLMPVIKDANDFLGRIEEEGGITSNLTWARPSELKPAQGEIRITRAMQAASQMNSTGILRLPDGKAADPILISQDNWIIDGHHRWVAAYRNGIENIPIQVIRIMAPFIKIIYYARNETTQGF